MILYISIEFQVIEMKLLELTLCLAQIFIRLLQIRQTARFAVYSILRQEILVLVKRNCVQFSSLYILNNFMKMLRGLTLL